VHKGSALTVSSLGSGSNGNAFLIEHGELRILIDAGVPIRTLVSCLKLRGLTPQHLTAALVSHEHSDHIRALSSLLKKARLPVLATAGTHAGLPDVDESLRHYIDALAPFQVGNLEITPVPVMHDARDPVGFSISVDDVRVSIMSDLGEASDINAEFASRSDHLIIESNYDEHMLRAGPYPAYLKKRIRSSDGHLGNDDCAEFLKDVVRAKTSSIWLCHLSENNNRPDVALNTTIRSLSGAGIYRTVAALPRYDGTITTWDSRNRAEVIQQSTLPF
jgi:phosphoribosyl 1,2-cyclic phosphodiesterase